MNRFPLDRRASILGLLVEGTSLRATTMHYNFARIHKTLRSHRGTGGRNHRSRMESWRDRQANLVIETTWRKMTTIWRACQKYHRARVWHLATTRPTETPADARARAICGRFTGRIQI